ncbi:MAG: GNAT family N-acetyltransferase [Petrimonas sp.]|jgi:ribosomal protein S18 acetylase RimI-like enzyme|nr:MAG: Acetyltransferase (GNAT) family protein [Bacteroidetes bacterium ADurb.BinA174]
MLQKLNNSQPAVAEKIRNVFQASYAVEAEILKAKDFPPLKRPIEKYIDTDTEFYGYSLGNEIVAVAELRFHPDFIHIQSLVVHPDHFRKGIASQMMNFILDSFTDCPRFMVETGMDNKPACDLYKKFGFYEIHQWDTDHGVRKIRFEKIMS